MTTNKDLISLNENGVVLTRGSFNPQNYFVADSSFSPIVSPVLLDSSVESLYTNKIITNSQGATTSLSVQINPFTEQLLQGTVYGSFSPNENLVQSTITPVLVNNYNSGGVTLDTFLPTVGTIGVSGEIGQRALQMKGTLSDLAAQKACGVQLPAFATSNSISPYFLIEGWMYFESEPSNNYDPIIITRSADGINSSTNDSFRLEYDTASDQVQFHYSTSTYGSAGYQGIVNVSPSGISLTKWNHFAVAWASVGGSASIKTYWNGTSLYSASGLSGSIRTSTAPLMIGSGASGDYPLKGWLEDIHIRMGGVTLALAKHAALGSTAALVWQHEAPGDYTVYQLTMNGPLGTSFVPVRNLCRVSGSLTYRDTENSIIGAGMIAREDSDVLGLTLFNGVCGGFSVSGGSAAYVFGADSGACMIVSSVQQLYGISAAINIRKNAADHTNYYLFGVTVMYGENGASGDFRNLLSSGWTGASFSFLPLQSNVNFLRNIYDNIVVNGYTGNTTIENYYGTPYVFGPTHAKKLYQDVISYQADSNTIKSQLVSNIQGATTFNALNAVTGYTTGVVLKLAGTATTTPVLFINPKAKESGTSIPESKYTRSQKYPQLGEPELSGF